MASYHRHLKHTHYKRNQRGGIYIMAFLQNLNDIIEYTSFLLQPSQHVPNMLVNAVFSALVMVKPYTLLTLIHILEYVQ